MNWSRRQVLGLAATAPWLMAAEPRETILDTHTHFYDPTRPEGVPWPGKGEPLLYRPVLPPEFLKLGAPLGVTETVVVEASPRIEDNQWLLDLAAKHPVIRGVVGRLIPTDDRFLEHLARFTKSPKFRGIRITHDDVKAALTTPAVLDRLKKFAEARLILDVNGGPDLPADVARLAKSLPELTIVLNHMGNVQIDGKAPPQKWVEGIQAAGAQPNVACKLSALVDSTRRPKMAPRDLAFYLPVTTVVADAFGPERLMFGSNWPVSDLYAPFEVVVRLAQEFVEQKLPRARAKIFRENAVRLYRLDPT